MTNTFHLNNTRLNKIEDSFKIHKESILQLKDDYTKLVENVPYQYLAHIMRTMEDYIRKNVEKAEYFRITCMPTEESKDELKDLACATYQEKYSFDIVYDRNMSETRKRVCIAHELGHLWLVIQTNKNYDSTHEPLSSIYGLLIMLHKLDCQKQNSNSEARGEETEVEEDKLIKEFLFIMNRNDGKYNTSQVFER